MNNPVRGRLNAAFFRLMNTYMDRKYATLKRRLMARVSGAVVELGAGAGANFRYLCPGTEVVAVEPNIHMHSALRNEAQLRGIKLRIETATGEDMPIEDGSADFVICSLVLCSVADPNRVLIEIKRILKPGGRFIFVEHVGAALDSPLRTVQTVLRVPWKWIFEGCILDRETEATIRDSGFQSVSISRHVFRSIFFPIRTQIFGSAIK